MLARCKFNLTGKGRGRKGREWTLREVRFHFFFFFLINAILQKLSREKKGNIKKGERKIQLSSSRLFEGSFNYKIRVESKSRVFIVSRVTRQRDVRWRTNNTFNVHSFVGKIFLLGAFLTSRFILLFAASFFFFSLSLPVRSSSRCQADFAFFAPRFYTKEKKKKERKEKRRKKGEIKEEGKEKNFTASILSCIHYNNKWRPSSISIFLQDIFDRF